MVTQAARDGDAVSVAILAEVGHWLGVGIGGLVNILDPEIVVMAGGVAEAGDLVLEPGSFGVSGHGRGRRRCVPTFRS